MDWVKIKNELQEALDEGLQQIEANGCVEVPGWKDNVTNIMKAHDLHVSIGENGALFKLWHEQETGCIVISIEHPEQEAGRFVVSMVMPGK